MPLPASHPLYTYYSQYSYQLTQARNKIASVGGNMTALEYLITWEDPVNGPIQWNRFTTNLTAFMRWAIASNWVPDQFPQLKFMYNEYDYWGGALDMDTLLTAMISATYEQLQSFIGIEDAYRSAIWDQPFNAQFYAALANGFRP